MVAGYYRNDDEISAIAHAAWEDAGVGERIERLGRDAAEALQDLLDENRADDFDLACLDADKERQIDYHEHCLRLVRRHE